MLIAQLITIALLYYQVTMPAVDNGKYTATVLNGELIRMNSQTGDFERCNSEFRCQPVSKE